MVILLAGCSQFDTFKKDAAYIDWDPLIERVMTATSPRILARKFVQGKAMNVEALSDGDQLRAMTDVHEYVEGESWKWNNGEQFLFYDGEMRRVTDRRVLRYGKIKEALATRKISEAENGLLFLGDGWEKLKPELLKAVIQENKDREVVISSITTQMLSQSIEKRVNLSFAEADDLVRRELHKSN